MPFPKFEVQSEIRIIPLLSLSFIITFGEVIVFCHGFLGISRKF
jgi:hypothetical protein